MKQPSARTHQRPQRLQAERRVVRIYCEGRVTEPDYVRIWGRSNDAIQIDWGDCGMVPMTLVERAREDLKHNLRSKKRHGVSEYDEAWCVFDMDSHPHVARAIFEARQSGINVAVSNPCFELWLVLHEEDCTRYVDRKQVQRCAKDLSLLDGKSIPVTAGSVLVAKYEDAKQRACALDAMHEGNGSESGSNPSTEVWRLVDSIRA